METVNSKTFAITVALFVISGGLFIQGCGGNTIYFEQTCVECVTSQWMVTQSMCADSSNAPTITKGGNEVKIYSVITETGEIIELSEILTGEGIISEYSTDYSHVYGKRIAMAKLKGRYYLTGDDFNFLWILTPAGQNQASLDRVPLPEEGGVKAPVFKIDISKGRFYPFLILSANNYSPEYILIADNEWKKKP